MSSTSFEQPSVHPQEDLYMQFYGFFFFMNPYKQSGRWQDVCDITHILPGDGSDEPKRLAIVIWH